MKLSCIPSMINVWLHFAGDGKIRLLQFGNET